MGEVSKNSWPSLTCHTVCHEVTTLTFLFALEGKSEKWMAKPESRSKRPVTGSQVEAVFGRHALPGSRLLESPTAPAAPAPWPRSLAGSCRQPSHPPFPQRVHVKGSHIGSARSEAFPSQVPALLPDETRVQIFKTGGIGQAGLHRRATGRGGLAARANHQRVV